MYILALQLKEPQQFERVHGEAVVSVVRSDVTRAFTEIAAALLGRHETLTDVLCPEFGVWLVAFELGKFEIRIEPEEQSASIAQAGRDLVRRMLQDQFGMAVAVRTEFRLAVLPAELASLEVGLLHEMARRKLEHVPYSGFSQPKIGREEFLEIVDARKIDLHLQPILSLETLKPVGFEALARGPVGSAVREAGPLFGAASYYGADEELDLACIATALEWAPRIPKPYWLSINMSPDLLAKASLKHLFDSQKDPKLIEREVLEITEHLPIHSSLKVHQDVAPYRERGARLALDDAGCGFFNMEMVRALSPDIVKICISVVRRIDGSPAVKEAVQDMVWRITEAGATALGEGVERPEQAEVLKACGVRLAQGFLYAKPKPAQEVLDALKA